VFAGPYVDSKSLTCARMQRWFAKRFSPILEARVGAPYGIRAASSPNGRDGRAPAFPTLRRDCGIGGPDPDALVLLGRIDQTNFFACEIEGIDPPAIWPAVRAFEDLRLVASLLPPDESRLAGLRPSRDDSRGGVYIVFCGSCGAKTLPCPGAAHVLVCNQCRMPAMNSFRGWNPAIIVLVSDGREGARCFGPARRPWADRGPGIPPSRASSNPGESLEDAVAREMCWGGNRR